MVDSNTIRLAMVAGLALGCAARTPEPQRETLMVPECSAPRPPDLPDGSTASRAEIVAAREHVTAFLTEADAYLECLSELEQILGPELEPERRNRLVADYNGTIDTMQGVAERFNVQLRAYKARTGDEAAPP